MMKFPWRVVLPRIGSRGGTVRRPFRWSVPTLWPYLAWASVAGLAVVLALTGVLAGAALAISGHLPRVDALYSPPSEATRIYAADGQLIASLYQENRASVALADIPETLRRAVIDTEDAAFYRHPGISLRGVLRASFRNVRERGLAEGGSTITQQLARNLFLTNEKALGRKIAEMLLAIQIERRLTKDEILERYLNQVYFGQGTYGVEAAAEVYFGQPVKALALPESALLAGLIRAPSYYSPYDHMDRARIRRAEVLQRMLDLWDITPQHMRTADSAPI
ncbi:MAG TPA: transglycosylase domain-containing protein, partial [bacterium]|nr:transglycosylase domain-containing protein [bacterium]